MSPDNNELYAVTRKDVIQLRYFAEGREDSLAMSTVAVDGSIYVAHSPLRRTVGKAMYPELTPDITRAVSDGDMTPENAGTLGDLLEQSTLSLKPVDLAVASLNEACAMFK